MQSVTGEVQNAVVRVKYGADRSNHLWLLDFRHKQALISRVVEIYSTAKRQAQKRPEATMMAGCRRGWEMPTGTWRHGCCT